jgi:serine/threonine protein kinase
LPKEDDG